MGQLKKSGVLIGFMLIAFCKGYCQDTTHTVRKIYKITSANVQSQDKSFKPGTDAKPVYSCEMDKTTKKVTVSKEQPDGTITKETYDLIEDKK